MEVLEIDGSQRREVALIVTLEFQTTILLDTREARNVIHSGCRDPCTGFHAAGHP